MLVPNSRDQHEKNDDQTLHITKHTLKYALFEEGRYRIALNYSRSSINAWSCLVAGGNSIITKKCRVSN